jgi:hypothetical protein
MKPGDRVVVYEDPITCLRREGTAKLIEQFRPDEGDGLSMWYVRFGDEPEVMRTINAAHSNPRKATK